MQVWNFFFSITSWMKALRPVHFLFVLVFVGFLEFFSWSTELFLLAIIMRKYKQHLLFLPSMQIQLHYVTCCTQKSWGNATVAKQHYFWTSWCFNSIFKYFLITFLVRILLSNIPFGIQKTVFQGLRCANLKLNRCFLLIFYLLHESPIPMNDIKNKCHHWGQISDIGKTESPRISIVAEFQLAWTK